MNKTKHFLYISEVKSMVMYWYSLLYSLPVLQCVVQAMDLVWRSRKYETKVNTCGLEVNNEMNKYQNLAVI